MKDVSVVVPAYNAEETLPDCLHALSRQSLNRDAYDVIVVDDGSSDGTAEVAQRLGARVVRRRNGGAAAARNTGWQVAQTPYVAFTDADCIPYRGWVDALLRAIRRDGEHDVGGAAGRTLGYRSSSPAARFADLTGSFDAQRHLAHPTFPFAPSGNVIYRRDVLEAVGGYDERYRSYEACDLHDRLRHVRFAYVAEALVFHRHRATWKEYWRQQRSYGFGYGQFTLARRDTIGWSPADELRAWASIGVLGVQAVLPAAADERLLRHGAFVKSLAQRCGFAHAYWHMRRNRHRDGVLTSIRR